jgi:hypothetical protein
VTTQEVEDQVRKLTTAKSQLASLRSQETALAATIQVKMDYIHQQLTAAGMAEGLDPKGDVNAYLTEANARLGIGIAQVSQVLSQYQAALQVIAPPAALTQGVPL